MKRIIDILISSILLFFSLPLLLFICIINLILNNTNQDLLDKNKINILWMQHFVNQKEAQNLGSKDYVDKLDFIVFNSNWNFEKFVYQFKVPESKCVVIKNAVKKIDYHVNPIDYFCLIFANVSLFYFG